MRTGFTISGSAHAAVLLWSLLLFTGATHRLDSTEALPVDVISSSEFSEMTHGAPNAPAAEEPKPVAENLGEASPLDDPAAPPANKEVKAAAEATPLLEPRPPEPKPKRSSAAPADPIADAIHKDDERKADPRRAEAKPPASVKKPDPAQFDPRKVAELLNKQTPQRVAATREQINDKLSLGTPYGTATRISQYELDALRARLSQLWSPPAGARNLRELSVTLRVKFNPDGSLEGSPKLVSTGSGPLFTAVSESAKRAILLGQPFTMLRPEHYELWREIEITFDQSMMIGG